MLKVKEISKDEIPEFILNRISDDVKNDFIEFYESEGMFGYQLDYLFVISYDNNGCFGYVYNGNAPECSEFGSFGLNESKTERVW